MVFVVFEAGGAGEVESKAAVNSRTRRLSGGPGAIGRGGPRVATRNMTGLHENGTLRNHDSEGSLSKQGGH